MVEPTPAGPRRPWGLTVAAAVVAGVVTWVVGQSLGTVFTMTPEELKVGDALQQNTDTSLFLQGDRRVKTYDTALRFGILGATVGLAMGLAGGASRRSATGMALGGMVGLAVGGGLAVLSSLVLVPIYLERFDPVEPSLVLPLMVLGGVWGMVGLAGGLALALGRGIAAKGLVGPVVGGALGALLGTFLYQVVYAVAFPLSSSEMPIPDETIARLLGFLIVAIGIAIAATRTLPGPQRSR